MSHIDKETLVVVMKTKGKKAGIKILPLAVEPKPDPAQKWANGFAAKCAGAPDRVALEQFAESMSNRLAELQQKRPDLHQMCMDALAGARALFDPEKRDDSDMGEGFNDDFGGEA